MTTVVELDLEELSAVIAGLRLVQMKHKGEIVFKTGELYNAVDEIEFDTGKNLSNTQIDNLIDRIN